MKSRIRNFNSNNEKTKNINGRNKILGLNKTIRFKALFPALAVFIRYRDKKADRTPTENRTKLAANSAF